MGSGMAHSLQSNGSKNELPLGTHLMQRRILIAEDNEESRQGLQKLLESDQKVKVDTVSDGIKALEHLSNQSYSIVITDLKMPRLDGIQLIEAIQKRHIPVTAIVTTG